MNRRFYEFEIATVTPKLEEMGVNSTKKKKFYCDLNQVCAIFESDDSDLDEEGTKIELENGESYFVYENYELIKSLLDANS